jgi:hypothetical protein
MIGIVMMSLVVSAAVAQSALQGQDTTQETQARGFWIDPSTKLMWTAKDSGKDLSYKGAVNYCRDLRLNGNSDWRLATLGELQGLYDKTANAPGLAGSHGKDRVEWHVKGNLFLTGEQWAIDLRGVRSNREYFFNFNDGRSDRESSGFWSATDFMRALCVRQSALQGQEATTETQARSFWTDPSTSLMWAAKDSGEDVTYESAVKYCRDQRLAGHSDWRLATLGELQGIYDKTANAPGLAGKHGEIRMLWHVTGNLFLTGYQWAYGESGRAGEYRGSFNFDVGRSNNGIEYPSFMRALCVRG